MKNGSGEVSTENAFVLIEYRTPTVGYRWWGLDGAGERERMARSEAASMRSCNPRLRFLQ